MDANANTAVQLEPLFLISDADVERIAGSRSRLNNSHARECGQSGTVTASELRDLYYNAGGRCVLCTDGLTVETIELDHIVECRYRAARKAAIAGQEINAGRIADINNMQWVCKKCNALKSLCRRNDVDLSEYVARVATQSQFGFPIRSQAKHLGSRGHANYRREVISQMIAEDPLVSSRKVCEALVGTPGEACYNTVLDDMKSLGWVDQRKGSYREKRERAIRAVVEKHGTHYETLLSFSVLVVKELQATGIRKNPAPQLIKETALAMNLFITFERVQKRTCAPCVGDEVACMTMLRSRGDDGELVESVLQMLRDRGLSEASVTDLINKMKERQKIYCDHSGARLIAALTRQEAADRIGVSKHRLKRWASNSYSHLVAGPAFSKGDAAKSATWYRRDDVDAFVNERKRHPLDLSAAGQRAECVQGGLLGGRPKANSQAIAG